MSEENTQDEKSAIARAEFLFTSGAPPDWIIITKEEVATIKSELAETKAKLEAVEVELLQKTQQLAKAVAALEQAVDWWTTEINHRDAIGKDSPKDYYLMRDGLISTLRDIRGGKDL